MQELTAVLVVVGAVLLGVGYAALEKRLHEQDRRRLEKRDNETSRTTRLTDEKR